MTFGEMLTETRKRKNMTIEKLVQLTDIHRQMIMRYERDKVLPSSEKLKRICEALQVSAHYLLFGSTIPHVKMEMEDLKFLEKILIVDKLEERYRDALKIMLDAMITKSEVEGMVKPFIK